MEIISTWVRTKLESTQNEDIYGKEIMKRSHLRSKFLSTRSDLDRKAYNKQRNYVVSLSRKEKKILSVILTLTFLQKIKLSRKLLNPI